ncbi:MAG: hypothetical protein H7A44_08095 [Opitutaceae bacterium]|nr:hypothetical protein [Cephaloticoccus sp.]MCP5530390.1 hypothetical protein [Opitutaceae bacterium]
MSMESSDPAAELDDLLALIKTGQLFAVQQWITDGRSLRPEGETEAIEDSRRCPLRQAVRSGFHSMVDVLVGAGGWPQAVLDEAYDQASSVHRPDIANLLRAHGATLQALDFAEVCRSMNQTFMEEALRGGCSPTRENAFAQALVTTGAARPLLSFLRKMRGEFPDLDNQAALALAQAASRGKARVASLLVWAGADPMREVPYELEDDNWDFSDSENRLSTTPAEAAIGSGKVEIVKALKLKPTVSQARELLDRMWRPSRELVRAIIDILPEKNLNVSERGSCPALEEIVKRGRPWSYGRLSPEKENENAIEAMEELLDAGARWNPPPDDLRYIRRCLIEHDPLHVVRVVRLLLYTPGACDSQSVLELCRTPTIRQRIHAGDVELWNELTALAKKR